MSPLCVRCPVSFEKFVNDEGLAKNSPDFFYTRETTQPVMPGSSLPGRLSGKVEPDIKLEVNTKVKPLMSSGSLSAQSTIEKEAGEAESIRLTIKSLKLPGEVNKAEGIVLLIEELTNDKYRVDCARKLKDRLMRINLKETHKEKPWWKSLKTIPGEQ